MAFSEAAVLVPVFRDPGRELRLLLVLRGLRGIHGGQLGLPGGKPEAADGSLLETALREAEEEVGLPREGVELLSELEPVEARTSGFRVHPFLARIDPPPEWRLAAGEIVGVVTPAVRSLADPAARTMREVSAPSWPASRLVDCIPIDGGPPLWGLTLRLLDPLLPRLVAGDWAV